MKFHMILTESDADIIAFKHSLPKGTFNNTVLKILRAATRGRTAEIPMCFEIDNSVPKLHTKIELNEDLVQSCYEKLGFEKGKFTTGVKAEIRKCIRKNLRTKNERIPIAIVETLFSRTLSYIEQKQEEYSESQGRTEAMLPHYRECVDRLIAELESVLWEGR